MESGYTVKFRSVEKYYTSMDLRRDRKRFLKFREMLETQGYTHKPWMQKRGNKEKPSQREGTHFKMCVISVRSLVSSVYSNYWSQSPFPNLIRSVNLNQLVIQRPGERESPRLRQLNAKLSQPRMQRQGERKKLGPRQLNAKLSQPKK